MIKGKEKAKTSENSKMVGFTTVEVKAVNPTRSELNALVGREPTDEDKEITYLGEDNEGNARIRLTFWLQNKDTGKFFVQSFNLTDKNRVSNDKAKAQMINSVGITAWAPFKIEDGQTTDEVDTDVLPNWFTQFLDKEKEDVGDKEYRQALLGEEELGTLLRSWLGRMSWNEPSASVLIDTKALFSEDYSELRGLIGGDYDTPFTILLGVKTDKDDSEKQYQQVYSKAYLPEGFMKYITKGKFPTDYSKKVWKKFEEDAEGEYGFKSYFELVPLKEYNSQEDPAASATTPNKEVTSVNSKF